MYSSYRPGVFGAGTRQEEAAVFGPVDDADNVLFLWYSIASQDTKYTWQSKGVYAVVGSLPPKGLSTADGPNSRGVKTLRNIQILTYSSFPNKEMVNEVNQTRQQQFTLCLLQKMFSCG